jgi:GntR family transcriptional regulator
MNGSKATPDYEFMRLAPAMEAADRSMWRQLKQILEYQIAIGNYPKGSTLPGVRGLALALGVNKNTVSRAYVELRREGLVESVKGKGVVVVNRPASKDRAAVAEEFSERVTPLIQQALWLGLEPARIREVLARIVDGLDVSRFPRVAYVECNAFDAGSLAEELTAQLSIPFEAVVLPPSPAQGSLRLREFDLVVTPLFHLQEVAAAMQDCPGQIEGVLLTPDVEVMLEIARLDSHVTLGLVALGDRKRSVASLADLLRSHTGARVLACAIYETAALQTIFSQADLIVDTLACHEQLMQLSPPKKVLTLRFSVDRQSVDYLGYRIRLLQQRA